MAGFGKAKEIRQDPTAQRTQWLSKLGDIGSGTVDVGRAIVRGANEFEMPDVMLDPEGSMETIVKSIMPMGRGGLSIGKGKPSADKVIGKTMMKDFEKKFGKPFSNWSRDEVFEFRAAKDLETGAAEAAMAKGAPRTSKAFKGGNEADEIVPTEPVVDDLPAISADELAAYERNMTGSVADAPPAVIRTSGPPPLINKSGEQVAQKITEVGDDMPPDVIAQAIGGTPLEKLVRKPRVPKAKPVQSAIDTTQMPKLDAPPKSTAYTIKQSPPKSLKEQVFQEFEAKIGRPRIEWTMDELKAAREGLESRVAMLEQQTAASQNLAAHQSQLGQAQLQAEKQGVFNEGDWAAQFLKHAEAGTLDNPSFIEGSAEAQRKIAEFLANKGIR